MSRNPRPTSDRVFLDLTAEEEQKLLYGREADRVRLWELKRSEVGRQGRADEGGLAHVWLGLLLGSVGVVTVLTLASALRTTETGVEFAFDPAVVVAAIAFYLTISVTSALAVLRGPSRDEPAE